MRMTLYYLTRSVKNQIRKLLHTWVAVFILVCFLFGALVGVGVGVLGSMMEEKYPSDAPAEDSFTQETLPDEEVPEELLAPDEATRNGLFELAVGGIALLVLVFGVLGADKSGGAIFLPADVNLLFSAPIKPQTVLLFRLLMQTGGVILATVYLLFQIPALVLSTGLGGLVVFALLAAWVLVLIFSRLVSVLCYTVTATYPQLKKYLRKGLLAVLLVLALVFLLYARSRENYFEAALSFFNAPLTRYIPLWGWLKAMVVFSLEGNTLLTFVAFFAQLALLVVMIFVIWRIKADFYEDAMARSQETAAQQQMQTGGREIAKRKKDRSDKLRREGFSRGEGASVYFYKVLYNRFRFAHFRIFTKTSETYLIVGAGLALLMRAVLESDFFPVIPMLLGGMVFFRSLGNPIAADVEMESFSLVPDSAHRKVFFSFAGGVVNSLLDLLPAMLLCTLILLPNPAEALLWLLLIVSMGAYSDSVGMFIGLSLSTGLSQTVRSLIQILFIYFGMIPAAVLLAIGYLVGLPLAFVGVTILFNLAVTGLSLALSPLLIANGRK